MTKPELESRYEVEKEIYEKKLEIEARIAAEIARTMILPVAMDYQGTLANNLITLNDLGVKAGSKALLSELEKVGNLVDTLTEQADTLDAAETHDTIIPALADIRVTVDTLETIIDNDLWPMAKYREMLFIY